MGSFEQDRTPQTGRDDRDVITMRTLGRNGRFGNQLFQYMFLRTYAHQHSLRVETPRWIGQYLYGFDDPPVSAHLPQVCEKVEHGSDDCVVPNAAEPFRNVDFWGYFQYHTSYYAPHQEFIRRLFTPLPWVQQACEPVWSRLRERGGDVIGIHIRRGDYSALGQRDPSLRNPFYVAPSEWYIDWLHENWDSWKRPIIYIASDEPEVAAADFHQFPQATCHSLTNLDRKLPPYFIDFYFLCHCRALALSNSTFSFFAAMLNNMATSLVRPFRQSKELVPFDPWNSYPLLRHGRE